MSHKITITVEESNGEVTTFTKSFDDDLVTCEGFFETCLRAYEANTFQTEVDINIGKDYGATGESKLQWDRHNGLKVESSWEKDPAEQLSDFLDTLEKELMKDHKHVDFGAISGTTTKVYFN